MAGYEGDWKLVFDYSLFIFIAVCGLLQLIAARLGLQGISFSHRKRWGYFFGTTAIVIAFCWFFISQDRSVLTFDAPVQLLWIFVGTICAYILTFTVSHLINRTLHYPKAEGDAYEEGVEVLKRMTYFIAVARYFKDKPR